MFKEASITRYAGKTEKSSFRKKVLQPQSDVTIGRPTGYGVLMQELSPFTFTAGVNQYAVFDGPVGY
jgi:hypothetical protein